jgi:RNA-binding protein YhbY
MYGYVAPYENKVPLNYNGFNPAIIPSVGYKLTAHDSVQVKILGNAALMFSYGRQF